MSYILSWDQNKNTELIWFSIEFFLTESPFPTLLTKNSVLTTTEIDCKG
jgi:hypothetical protein